MYIYEFRLKENILIKLEEIAFKKIFLNFDGILLHENARVVHFAFTIVAFLCKIPFLNSIKIAKYLISQKCVCHSHLLYSHVCNYLTEWHIFDLSGYMRV